MQSDKSSEKIKQTRLNFGRSHVIDREKGLMEFYCRLETPRGFRDYIIEVRGKVTSPGRIEIGIAEIIKQIESQLSTLLADDAIYGENVLKNIRAAHKIKHGTDNEKQERQGMYRREVIAMLLRSPRMSYNAVTKKVAEKFGVCKRTIQRYVPKTSLKYFN
jgi:hypothetical protein